MYSKIIKYTLKEKNNVRIKMRLYNYNNNNI